MSELLAVLLIKGADKLPQRGLTRSAVTEWIKLGLSHIQAKDFTKPLLDVLAEAISRSNNVS